MKTAKKPNAIFPLFLFFMVVTIGCFTFADWLDSKKIDHLIVISGNCLLFLLTVIVFYMHQKTVENKNPHAFVRSVMAGTALKMLVVLAAIAAYLYFAAENKSPYAVVATIALYFVYTFIEVKIAAKLNKEHGAN